MKWNDISNFFSASPLGWTHQQFSAVPHTHCPPDLSPPLQLSFRCSPIVICLFWYWGAQTCTQWSRWGCISTAYRGTVPSLNQLVMPWLYLSSLEYLLLSKCSCEHCLVTVMCVFSFNTCTQESHCALEKSALPGLASQCTQPGSRAAGRWSGSVLSASPCEQHPAAGQPCSSLVMHSAFLFHKKAVRSLALLFNWQSKKFLERKEYIVFICLLLWILIRSTLAHLPSGAWHRKLLQNFHCWFLLYNLYLFIILTWYAEYKSESKINAGFALTPISNYEPHLFTQLCEHKFHKSESKWTEKNSGLRWIVSRSLLPIDLFCKSETSKSPVKFYEICLQWGFWKESNV